MEEPDKIAMICTECKTHFEVSPDEAGKDTECPECGAVLLVLEAGAEGQPQDKYLGKVFGGCKIRKKLGQGGMGAVYLAKHINLQKNVAIKILSLDAKTDKSLIERFVLEARSAARLEHPNVVTVHNVDVEHGTLFIEMEYISGQNLADLAERLGRIDVDIAVKIMIQAARGLSHAHQKGIVHRDIKPENLMINKDGTVKVTDFGLAKQVQGNANLTMSGMIVGTPYYISPEQAKGEKVDRRADIYSLGATLYYVVTGKKPFEAETPIGLIVKHIEGDLTPPKNVFPGLPDQLNNIIMKMMKKDPADRYQSTDEILVDLEGLQNARLEAGKTIENRKAEQKFLDQVKAPSPSGGYISTPGGTAITADVTRAIEKSYRRKPSPVALFLTFLLTAALCFGGAWYALQNRFLPEQKKQTQNAALDHFKEFRAKYPSEAKSALDMCELLKQIFGDDKDFSNRLEQEKALIQTAAKTGTESFTQELDSNSRLILQVEKTGFTVDKSKFGDKNLTIVKGVQSVVLDNGQLRFMDDNGEAARGGGETGLIVFMYGKNIFYVALKTGPEKLALALLAGGDIASWQDDAGVPLVNAHEPIIDRLTANDVRTSVLARKLYEFMRELRAKQALLPENKTLNMEQFLNASFSLKNGFEKSIYLVSSALYYTRKEANDIVSAKHRACWSPAPLDPGWLDLERSFSFKGKPELTVCAFDWDGATTNDYRVQFVYGNEIRTGIEEANCQNEKMRWVGQIDFPEKVVLSSKSKKGEIKLLMRLAVLADSLEAIAPAEKPGGQESPDQNPVPMVLEIKPGRN